jgi:uncharacterized Rossmann fold enzyme
MPITAMCFSDDSSILVHAHGEDWSLGAETAAHRMNVVKIYARNTELSEVFR